jgi:hypothetical protein
MKNITQNSISPPLGLENFKLFSLNPTHEGLLNISRVCPNSFIIFSFDLNKISVNFLFNIQQLFHCKSKHYETNLVHPNHLVDGDHV